MVIVVTPLYQDKVIELIREKHGEDISFKEKQGINLYFTSETLSDDDMAAIIKKTIKASTFGASMMFKVLTKLYV